MRVFLVSALLVAAAGFTVACGDDDDAGADCVPEVVTGSIANDEFCEEFDNDTNHPDGVKIAHGIFFHTQAIRDQVKKSDAEGAALEALVLEHQAAKLMGDFCAA